MNKHRFVIVCLLKGDALKFHETLINNIKVNFKVSPQKLPAHFTIKAPFEISNLENISILENLISDFCINNKKQKITIDGFNHFSNRVIYMNIKASQDAMKTYDNFIYELKKLPWLEWKRNEFKQKVFHCTVATKFNPEKFDLIWNFVCNYSPNFQLYFDNISILEWKNYKWNTYKEFKLMD